MATPGQLLLLARQRHQAGDLAAAETFYRQLLQADAGNADAWHLLGILITQQGRPDQAVDYLTKALVLRPGVAAFHLNFAVACQMLARRPEALTHFQEAVRLQPDLAEAHNNLANVLAEEGQNSLAVAHWEHAIRLRPDYVEAHNNLGQILQAQNRMEEAVAHYREAIRLRPNFARAHYNLGNVHTAVTEFEKAEQCYEAALRFQPDSAPAYSSLGHVLRKQGRLDEAAVRLRQALHMQPESIESLNEMGVVLAGQGKLEEAARHFQRVLSLKPDDAESLNNLGVVRKNQQRMEEAVVCFQKALQASPDLVDGLVNLGNALTHLGRVDEAVDYYQQALCIRPDHAPTHCSLACALTGRGQLQEAAAEFREALRLDPQFALAHSSLLMTLNYDPDLDPATLLEEHKAWAAAHAQLPLLGPLPEHDRRHDRSLRVGYISGDFFQHVTARFVEPILTHHDPEQFQVYCYSDVLVPDLVSIQLQSPTHRWQWIGGLTDVEVAERIRTDAIDILVDLGGHTGNRLGVFARKPAPIQVTYLGYPATTGLSAIDYRLTDVIADPPDQPSWHTEELVRLSGGFCCYSPAEGMPEVGPLPASNNGWITFGSTHKLAKLNDRVLYLWAQLLRAIPDARLLIFRDAVRGSTRARLVDRLIRRGITGDRLLLAHEAPQGHHLNVYHQIDILLDVFPWSGHATACEALWMGVPVLTLAGGRHASRMVASVLWRLDLAELIAQSPEEYLACAARWASDPKQLSSLRSGMRDRMRRSSLCDGKTFTQHLESAYRAEWHRWVTNE